MRAYIALLILAFAAVTFAQATSTDSDMTVTFIFSDPTTGPSTVVAVLPDTLLSPTTTKTSSTPKASLIATVTSPTRTSSPTSTGGEFNFPNNAVTNVAANRFTNFLIGSAVVVGALYQMI
jgi:hypothetical protein